MYTNQKELTMQDALESCKKENLTLVLPRTAEDNNGMKTKACDSFSQQPYGIWMGASKRKNDNKYLDVSGSPLKFTNWATDQPDTDSDCVVLSCMYKAWYTYGCTDTFPYFCQ
ncbi:hypothetical protein DMENIID0001_042340 [Sergentomyia squamirostris]